MVVELCSKLVCAFLLDPSSFAQMWNSQTQSMGQERYEGTNTVVARSELDDDVDCLECGSWESRFFVVYCLLACFFSCWSLFLFNRDWPHHHVGGFSDSN